jgi:hypothetical protein
MHHCVLNEGVHLFQGWENNCRLFPASPAIGGNCCRGALLNNKAVSRWDLPVKIYRLTREVRWNFTLRAADRGRCRKLNQNAIRGGPVKGLPTTQAALPARALPISLLRLNMLQVMKQ